LGRWEILTRVVPRLGDGSYLAAAKISRRQVIGLTISSDRRVRADVDGESIGQLPMSVALLPRGSASVTASRHRLRAS